ncbi:MAG: BMP family ABC transporter substrate-binding protein [Candidatus Thorarchaeota archaeon]
MIPPKQIASKFLIAILLLLFLFPLNVNHGANFQSIQRIAVIIDTSQFYDSTFIDDLLNGFDAVNETFGIDYDPFLLTNYTEISRSPYIVSYTHNQTTTNHSLLAKQLINSGQYDLIVIAGYTLRWGFFNISDFTQPNFLFYDLSGEVPYYTGENMPSNLAIVSFRENELGYMAGALTMAIFNPTRVAMVGTYLRDPRSNQLLAGFQSAVFRNVTEIDEARIDFIGHWANATTAAQVGNNLKSEFEVLFAGVQSNNTNGLRQGFTGPEKHIVSVDSTRPFGVMKNNTKTLMFMFDLYNQTGFFGGKVSFGIEDDVFYPTDWEDPLAVNKTVNQIYQEVVEDDLIIPTNFRTASNTPGLDWFMMFGTMIVIAALVSLRPRLSKKDR